MSVIGRDPAPMINGKLWVKWSDGVITLNDIDPMGYVLIDRAHLHSTILSDNLRVENARLRSEIATIKAEALNISGHTCPEERHSCDL